MGRWGNWDRRRALRMLVRLLAGIVAVPVLYLAAALLLGAVPVNAGFVAPAQGVTIFVRSNGVHTWIVMPKVSAQMDWRPYALPQNLRDPRWGAADHVAIGYGNRDVYLNTPTWADLTAGSALAAAFGRGPSLLHVELIHQPAAEPQQRPIRITPEQYRALVAFILPRFQRDGAGRPIPVPGRGYGNNDIFYEANGGYSAILTCNEWTGRALRAAGVRMGAWTPLEQSIMWRLD